MPSQLAAAHPAPYREMQKDTGIQKMLTAEPSGAPCAISSQAPDAHYAAYPASPPVSLHAKILHPPPVSLNHPHTHHPLNSTTSTIQSTAHPSIPDYLPELAHVCVLPPATRQHVQNPNTPAVQIMMLHHFLTSPLHTGKIKRLHKAFY